MLYCVQVLWDLTAGVLGQAPAAVTDHLPAAKVEAAAEPVEDEQELQEMQSRLQQLRS